MAELDGKPLEEWTESDVSSWLRSIGVKEQYVQKLEEEEVDGKILREVTEDYLKKETGMKSGPALLIVRKRNELVESFQGHKLQKTKKTQRSSHNRGGAGRQNEQQGTSDVTADAGTKQSHPETQPQTHENQSAIGLTTKKDCKPRPFGKEGIDFTYVKHNVLQPESGVIDLITPCHEYKSLANAAKLDRTRLQAKFAKEVLKFGAGCMNIRTNGTIHFGVMDSRDDTNYTHGEIIGIPVKEKDIFVDALDYTERCFTSDSEHVRQCIRPPQFIEVIDINNTEKLYVVEVDIVPTVNIVRNKVYSARLPNFKESSNKVELEKEAIYRRVGSKTEPVIDQNVFDFYQRVKDKDNLREEAEKSQFLNAPDFCEDLGRKLTMLVTSGKKFIEKEKWYILVTNKFQPDHLQSIDFLLNMKIFCVFDFDPDSKVSGFCGKYLQHHAANLHFMQNYKIPNDMTDTEFARYLHLFEQTSWIFCNGRNDFRGNEIACDEMTWIKTKITLLRQSVSLICNKLLPKGSFSVIFLLTSPVEKPQLHTFYEFFTEMKGHEDIICIAECEEDYQKWKGFAEAHGADTDTVNRSSVVGMKMSHVNATLQRIQPLTTRATKHLSVFTKGECLFETKEEERMYSLEILSVDQCDDTSTEFIEAEKENLEGQFYHGGKVKWLNFWLAEKKYVEEIIQRDAYGEILRLLRDIQKRGIDQVPVSSINIYHHPGSGGSTVARQVLWNNRKDLRCAVVKPSYLPVTVFEHAVHLREYEEKDPPQKCLPVLLLVEDCENDYLDDLRNELLTAVYTKKVAPGTPCFILLSCRRSHNPQKKCKESPLQNVAVTHQLSPEEKRQFSWKREKLVQQYQPKFILTFVLMSEEFKKTYIQDFVEHLLQDIDHGSVVTRLIQYVALLNAYVQNSFISQSHCEVLMRMTIQMDRFRQHTFERSLSEQAKLIFIHLRDDKTHIHSICIIHPKVAKEILRQLSKSQQKESGIAMDLLREDLLYENRFGREEYVKFLRDLFMRRSRIIKGDETDSLFSPLIEHVMSEESPDKAIELLKEAYTRFNQDAFFAQQLARLNYTHEKFEEAEKWADIAAKKMPKNSYILDTKGQVYRRWFSAKCKEIEKMMKTPQNTADAIEKALKAIDCFKVCQSAAISDPETMNNSGFFAAVEVGCNLLKLIFSLQLFSSRTGGNAECLKYLVTEYIPEEVKKPWESFHGKLKGLQISMHGALERISEDLSYFQTEVNADEDETAVTSEFRIKNPKNWLVNKSAAYGKYFSSVSQGTGQQQGNSNPMNWTPFMKRMQIYHLGGGNITAIFSLLHDQPDKGQIQVLEEIISLYPSNPLKARLDQMDLVNYIASQIALGCLSNQSPKLAPIQYLQNLRQQFPNEKCLSSALFLLTLLFWPEDNDNDKETKYEIVMDAVECLSQSYRTKMKEIPQRKRRLFTHFFLGNGNGRDKIVHKSKVESLTKELSVSEKRMKWLSGEVWKMADIKTLLKPVHGWTEDGQVFLQGPQKKKFQIPALNLTSVPYGNENVTFYVGFTFRGPVAHYITEIR